MTKRHLFIQIIKIIGQIIKIIGLMASMMLAAATGRPSLAQEASIKASFASKVKEPVPVSMLTGQSCLIIFDQQIGRLSVSNQEPVEAIPVSRNQMIVNSKALGKTRLTVWSKQEEEFLFFDVDVRANLDQIDAQVRALFPKEDIRLSQANGAVVVSGKVNQDVAKQVESVVQAAGFKTVNLFTIPVQYATQVQLQVRVAEVSRNRLAELAASPVYQPRVGHGAYTNPGIGPWTASKVEEGNLFGTVANTLNVFLMSNNAFLFLRALQTQGALRGLAEPNLIAMNGQQASFLAGGEVPIPVIQASNNQQGPQIAILFKEYGVRVNFKPTIIDEQHIRLELEPEVSTLDYTNAVRFSGFLIPALRVRRAKTGVELQDGQSFGIAGLLDNNELKSLSKVPVIGDIPILGNLFKSKSFQRNETELVFIVTAKITQPMNPDSVPQMRGIDGLKGESPLGVEARTTGKNSAPIEKNTNDKAAGVEAETNAPMPAKNVEEVQFPNLSEPTPAKPEVEIVKPVPASWPIHPPSTNKALSRKLKSLEWKLRTPNTNVLTAQKQQ